MCQEVRRIRDQTDRTICITWCFCLHETKMNIVVPRVVSGAEDNIAMKRLTCVEGKNSEEEEVSE